MSVQKGAKWNFAYVLPADPDAPDREVKIVVPSALQMGWNQSPGFLCAASETARDVAKDRCAKMEGSLPAHKLKKYLLPPGKWPKKIAPKAKETIIQAA